MFSICCLKNYKYLRASLRVFSVSLMFVCLNSTDTFAQRLMSTPNGVVHYLNLSEAIERGLDFNFDVKLAKIDQQIARTNNDVGMSNIPRVNFGLNQYNRVRVDASPVSFLNGAYTRSEFTATLDASWVIFDGFYAKIGNKQLEQIEDFSRGNAKLVVQNTINAVILAYYNALIEKEKMLVYQESLRLSAEKKTNAKLRSEYGDLARHDLLNFQNAFLNDSITMQLQLIVYQQTLNTLKYLIGYERNDKVSLTDELRFERNKLDFQTLEDALISDNRDIKNELLNIRLASTAIELAKAGGRPVLEFNTGISEELGTSKFTGDPRRNGAVFDYYFSFSFNYKLFDRKRVNQKIEVARLEKDLSLMSLEQKKNNLKGELRFNYDDYSKRQDILNLQEKLIANQTESLGLYKDRFEGGYSVFIEYRGAQLELLKTKLQRLETIYNLKVAETEILRLTGGIGRHI